MTHSFNTEIAKKHGIEEAILIENIAFWIKKNIANRKNFHNNKCYTYNSVKAFSELFEYMSYDCIRRKMEKLEKNQIIEVGNFNKNQYDRTKHYTIINKEICEIYDIDYSICIGIDENEYENEYEEEENSSSETPNAFGKNAKWSERKCQMDLTKMPNGVSENAKPIPDNNTYINKNIITSELDSLVNHDAVELESPASPNNNILKSDSGISQSDFQADDQAILSASDNLKQDAHSDTESPLTENCPPKNKNSIQKDNIQNNGIDIELQKIRQAEKQELINFKTELLKSYSRLMGRMPSELKQTETLKTEKARAELKAIFKARKYDWRECIEYAERKVERHDFDFRWYNFLKTLKRILESGLEDGSIRCYYSAEKRYYKDLERKKEYEKEMAEMRAEEQAEADKLGMTLEEYREWVREENDRAMAKFEAEMKARFEAERKAKNEADGIKTLTSGIKADTSEPRANEGLSTSEADAQNMAKVREELKARAEQNKTANKNILELLKNGGMQAVYQSL